VVKIKKDAAELLKEPQSLTSLRRAAWENVEEALAQITAVKKAYRR